MLERSQSPDGQYDPVVVCGADEGFAMPLAVTIASAIINCGPGRRLSFFVLDGGLSRLSAKRIASQGEAHGVAIHLLQPDMSAIGKLPVSGHVNLCTYLRLLMGRMLPQSIRRAIYLDADVMVRADLGKLWETPLEGMHCKAAQELSAPVMDARIGLPSFRRCARYLSTLRPIPNYLQFGLSPMQKYFNAGVLLVDLARWRADGLDDKLLKCLHDNRRHVRWWDQYALNVVLAGKWGELDCRWNQTSRIHEVPSWTRSPLEREDFERLRRDPYIVHFNSRRKPWQPGCGHPFREEFLRYVDMTPWSGFRPQSPVWSFRRWRRERMEDALVLAGRQYRAWLATWT